jgi:hypothetical protein
MSNAFTASLSLPLWKNEQNRSFRPVPCDGLYGMWMLFLYLSWKTSFGGNIPCRKTGLEGGEII